MVKKKTIKTNSALYKINNNFKLPGKYYDRYAAEQAFVLQNEYRKVLENKVSFGRMFYTKYVKQGQRNLLMISVIINL